MPPYPKQLAATGLRSIGLGEDGCVHVQAEISDGPKTALGRMVMITLDERSEQWLAAVLARRADGLSGRAALRPPP